MYDILHSANGDVDLETGDIRLAEPTEQHQRDMLIAGQGQFRESPEMGVDSILYLQDADPSNYLRAIRKQFAKDGMRVKEIKYRGETLTIDAEYENHNR